MDLFDRYFDRLIGHEGGYVWHADDPGGETKWGISKRSYPQLDIKGLTRERAREIYRADFWRRGELDRLPSALSFQVFDAAVNHGIETAIRLMQRAAGVADDGHVGPVTLSAIRSAQVTDLVARFVAERLDYWTGLSTWPTFGRGWARRAANNLRYMAEDS